MTLLGSTCELQDGPQNSWPADLVASKIAEAVAAVNADMVGLAVPHCFAIRYQKLKFTLSYRS